MFGHICKHSLKVRLGKCVNGSCTGSHYEGNPLRCIGAVEYLVCLPVSWINSGRACQTRALLAMYTKDPSEWCRWDIFALPLLGWHL